MSRLRFARKLAVVALLLSLAAPWHAAAAPRGSGAVQSERSISSLAQVWSWFVSLWGGNAPAPTADLGCDIDPGGHCTTGPAAASGATLAWGLAALMHPGRLSPAVLRRACRERIRAADLDDTRRRLLLACVAASRP